jgi:hypothetical protein
MMVHGYISLAFLRDGLALWHILKWIFDNNVKFSSVEGHLAINFTVQVSWHQFFSFYEKYQEQ